MCGGRESVSAILPAHVRFVVSVAMRIIETTARVNADGLKMWVFRPPLSHLMNSLPRAPRATIANWKKNQSSLNQMKTFVLRTIGRGPKPRRQTPRRDHDSSESKA